MADTDDSLRNKLVTEKDLEPGIDVDPGGKLGFFGADPVVQPAAYTQTYSTATRTVTAATAVAVTLADGAGTNDGTAAAITDVATAKAAIQELNATITALVADQLVLRKLINSLIDDLQALGLAQ